MHGLCCACQSACRPQALLQCCLLPAVDIAVPDWLHAAARQHCRCCPLPSVDQLGLPGPMTLAKRHQLAAS